MNNYINTIQSLLKRNAPTLLSSTAMAGVVTTAYLASKATVQAVRKIEALESTGGTADTRKQRLKERVPRVWKFYIPAAASGAVTIGSIAGTAHLSNRRMAAAQAAFVLSERAFTEYRDKVVEEYGARKDETIRASIAEDRIRETPPSKSLVVGSGDVLCCELQTMRYFSCDMETLRRAENDINARLVRHDVATLDDFYYLIGMQSTANSGDVGWNSDKLLSIEFSSVLDERGRPCLAFSYNYLRPIYDGVERSW